MSETMNTGSSTRPVEGIAEDMAQYLADLQSSSPLQHLQQDFAELGLRLVLLPVSMAPEKIVERSRPQAWVDLDQHQALCISVPTPQTSVSDILYVGSEALAVAQGFPRDPGNAYHEALVNSFALNYVTEHCGVEQAHQSFRVQLRKAEQARLRGPLTQKLREHIALRCWAISTAISGPEREVLLDQLDRIDIKTAQITNALIARWGLEAPLTGAEAQRLLRG